jgi:hypothetical protein
MALSFAPQGDAAILRGAQSGEVFPGAHTTRTGFIPASSTRPLRALLPM